MPRFRAQKNSFSAGEISPLLFGRKDLRAYENGATRLRNVYVDPTGGVIRRPGLRFLDNAYGKGRLIGFEFNTEQVYLLVLSEYRLCIYRDGIQVAQIESPWHEHTLTQINWTQSADTLLVVHPDVPPKKIQRSPGEVWSISDWVYTSSNGRLGIPHLRFADDTVTLQPSAVTGSVRVTASKDVFSPLHVGTRFRIQNREIQISEVESERSVLAHTIEALAGLEATVDWTEQAFSGARGWPVSVTFHQDRLVVGGSRDQPNRIWFSRAGDLFNFELGEGLDDESIEFPILSDQLNAIRSVFSGRHLQVFTSGAEWMVTGEPLTPSNIQVRRQTRVGSLVNRTIAPRDVDGATLFISRNGRQVREFLFADAEQAYQATDLALLASHLIEEPVDMDYDERRRLLYLVTGSGNVATLTVYRAEQISAWTMYETDGRFHSVCAAGDNIFFLVERAGAYCLEVLDDKLCIDCGLEGVSSTPREKWTGISHLEGKKVKIIADETVVSEEIVSEGAIFIAGGAQKVQVGIGFSHVIEPLPDVAGNGVGASSAKYRPIAITFKLYNTGALCVDVGQGIVEVPFSRFGVTQFDKKNIYYSGDKIIRRLGWLADGTMPSWRIEQDAPVPFCLLSVSTDVSVSN